VLQVPFSEMELLAGCKKTCSNYLDRFSLATKIMHSRIEMHTHAGAAWFALDNPVTLFFDHSDLSRYMMRACYTGLSTNFVVNCSMHFRFGMQTDTQADRQNLRRN